MPDLWLYHKGSDFTFGGYGLDREEIHDSEGLNVRGNISERKLKRAAEAFWGNGRPIQGLTTGGLDAWTLIQTPRSVPGDEEYMLLPPGRGNAGISEFVGRGENPLDPSSPRRIKRA